MNHNFLYCRDIISNRSYFHLVTTHLWLTMGDLFSNRDKILFDFEIGEFKIDIILKKSILNNKC
jgi:hypothetical protein